MTLLEEIQMKKNEALNKIRGIYLGKNKIQYDHFGDCGSYSEQLENRIRYIIEQLEKDITRIKQKVKT